MDSGGQLVKTRELFYLFQEKPFFGKVRYVDTSKWKKFFPFKVFELFFKLLLSNFIIMLPASNGLRVFSKIIPIFRKNKSIYYDVIGGWLPKIVENNPKIKKSLFLFNGILVETTSMKNALNELGLDNVYVVPNFKEINGSNSNQNERSLTLPLPVCTFSRVVKEKGIGEAIESIKKVNSTYNQIVYKLDIYGPIDDSYKEEFYELISKSSDYVTYMGVIDTKKSYDVLVNYFALLFPTKFYTEGIPGTFIDAYNAGLPVITSLWMNYSDIFEDSVHGYGYEFEETDGLYNCLIKAYQNKEEFSKMGNNCKNKSLLFGREHAFRLMKGIFKQTEKKKN